MRMFTLVAAIGATVTVTTAMAAEPGGAGAAKPGEMRAASEPPKRRQGCQRSQVKAKHFRSPLGRLALLAGAGLLLLVTGCSRNEPGSTTAAESNPAAATNSPAAAAPSDFAATLPHVGGPAGYVGSKS